MRRYMRYIICALAFLPLLCVAQRSRKFMPIYGKDSDINRTLTFITDNLLFDSLTYTRLANLDGYVHCTFNVDQKGKIVDIKITKGLAMWLDYEIINSMKELPEMAPFTNRKGELQKVRRDVYFTFNSSDENSWPNPYNQSTPDMTTASIDAQRKEQLEKIAKAETAWNEFTTDNTKISLDGKGIYKPGVLPNNPLNIKTPPPKPPIKITIKSE